MSALSELNVLPYTWRNCHVFYPSCKFFYKLATAALGSKLTQGIYVLYFPVLFLLLV